MPRKYQVKKKNSFLKSRFFWLAVLASLAMGGVVYLVWFCPFFQIKEILVAGNERINAADIQQLLWPKVTHTFLGLTSRSVFLADPRSLRTLLIEQFPLIDTLQVKRQLPQFLTVDVGERKAIGLWCWQNDCFSLDEKGVIFEPSQATSHLTIKSQQPQGEVRLGKQVIESKELNQILTIQQTLKEKANLKATEFTFFEEELRLNAKTSEGWEAFFDLKENLDWQLVRLELLLKKELSIDKRTGLEYVDLRFSKVYYK